MLNYLFCLDKNYNKQLLISLNSLNFYSKSKFNVYIIHKDPASLDDLMKRFNIKFDKIDKFNTYQFDDSNFNFPNLENNHISEATYYRFFIDDFIEENIEQLIYLDCDILCLNEPDDLLIEVSESLKKSNNVIAASVEYTNTVHTSELFNRLELESNTYFNAGVMVIDFKAWKENNLKQKLLSAMDKIYDKVNFWDQDILNFVFDGKYLEISRNFNFSTQLNSNVKNIDLRSEKEFLKGTIPGSTNIPILTNEEYQKVGKQYKAKGQEAATKLGFALVNDHLKKKRIDLWIDHIEKNHGCYIFCYKGGLRSKIAYDWLKQQNIAVNRLRGGYKEYRSYIISQYSELIRCTKSWKVIGGLTGSGKTELLNQFDEAIDLERIANHRGSAFGKNISEQPSQANFENIITHKYLNHILPKIYIEDGGSITNSNNISGLIINFDNNNSGNFSISNSNIYGALLNYGSNFEIINNTSIVGSVVSNYLVTINDGSSITKGNLPSFYGTNFGLSSSVIPGSYLEY